MPPTSKGLVRQINQQNILQTIFNEGPISRSQISKDLKLNKVTVSDIVAGLLDQEIISEIGEAQASQRGGRKPVMLQVNAQYGYTVSFDIGYKSVDMMVNLIDGSVAKFLRLPARERTIDERLAWIATQLDVAENFPDTNKGMLGVAVALHAVVLDGVVFDSPFIEMGATTVRDFLEQHVNVPVVIENEANLTAICQSDFTNESIPNQVTISIHKGIGAGIIIDGNLYRGIDGRAGEIGRIMTYNENPEAPGLCKIEQLCSEDAVVDQARKVLGDPTIGRAELLEQAILGNQAVLTLLDRFARMIALLIHDVANTFAPTQVLLNSPLIDGRPQLLDQIKREFKTFHDPDIQVKLSCDVEHAILLGGCALVVHHVFDLGGRNLKFHVTGQSEIG